MVTLVDADSKLMGYTIGVNSVCENPEAMLDTERSLGGFVFGTVFVSRRHFSPARQDICRPA